jgi:radical SAM superfamily enzyme YgiQ (UPF0313 family)
MNKIIKRIAFVYLTQTSSAYLISENVGDKVQRRPQLGLQYLSAALNRIGIDTAIFDQTVHPFDLNQLIKKLANYDIVGFYCSDPQEGKVKSYSQRIKEKLDVPILVGGPSTLDNSSFLDYGCDIVIHGEGEITIQQIIEHYNGQREKRDIKGISFRNGDRVVKPPPQTLIKDLDEIPFPDRSKIDINAYHDYFLFGMKKPYVTMIASRGCFYRCTFCTSCRIWEYRYRQRSPDNVVREIDDVVKKYKVKYVAFQDDIFGINNTWIEEFCRKLLQRPYKIRWMAILHPLSLKTETEKILRLMRKVGCDTLSLGLQSAHPQILKNINRNPSEPENLKKILKIANRLGFITAVGYVMGLPGDTKETIQTTIDYSLNCNSTLANYYMLSVLRGSEIDEKYRNRKICELTKGEIEKFTVTAYRSFYTRPKAILRIAHFIIKNPTWLIVAGINIPSILPRIGFTKIKRRRDNYCSRRNPK